jgi:hypothetical protein
VRGIGTRRNNHPSRRARAATAAALALLCLAGVSAQASAAPESHAAEPVSWTADLSRTGSDDVNVRYTAGALKVRAKGFRPASGSTGSGYGAELLSVHRLGEPANRVRAELDADVPSGAGVLVDVRGRAADGTWTEWRQAADGTAAVLPRPVTEVQARITFDDPTGRAAVHGLRLSADNVARPRSASAVSAVSSRVYATREGLVGGTTANGHVIQPNDHFVALPSRRGLSPNGSGQYSVQVCGPARCETAPVWDVGPWNTHDDYWNPSSARESFKDLAQGLPEAQAAYESGYNGGKDGSGRTVLNPAGIDLADGTFYNVGLNNNGWVTVTYLWTGGGTGGTSFPTWGTGVNIRAQATTDSAVVATLAGPTQVNVSCQVHGQPVTYQGITNDAWAYLPDYKGYISNIFIDVPDAWLPGVPTC